jgi:predicted nucleic acid-binding protein
MTLYLDTSIVLRVILRQAGRLSIWGNWQEACSSELMGVEARRSIDRLRLAAALDDDGVAQAQQELRMVEAAIRRIAVNRPVLRRASQPMATQVKTLDAVHLASALLFQERAGASVIFATHDARQALAARALGFDCVER